MFILLVLFSQRTLANILSKILVHAISLWEPSASLSSTEDLLTPTSRTTLEVNPLWLNLLSGFLPGHLPKSYHSLKVTSPSLMTHLSVAASLLF